jgi:type IV pilus modification protein PilV
MNIYAQNRGLGTMKNVRGFTILDVLLGILVFAVGMLALASLQTNLTRSSVDANTRTVATNIGEEIIERLRSFRRLTTDPDGQVFAFADIDNDYVETLLDGAGNTVTRAGLQYTIDAQVAGHVFNDDGITTTSTATAAAGAEYDFKLVNLTISWDSSQQFTVDESTQVSSADAGSGSITLTGVIPAIPSLASAMVAATDDDFLGGIPVDYTPGLRPDIVAIALENGKFKESTTPEPTVIRQDELSETWFDVVTYSTVNDTVFLRREEFLVVGCECNDLQLPDGAQRTGFLPAIWNGTEYAIWNGVQNAEGAGTELDMVSKPYGQSANSQQSAFCNTCCRDHHDSSTYRTDDYLFNPSQPSNEVAGDRNHTHYRRGVGGVWEEVGYGETGPKDDYLESCRMVRKDGFMRVAQDFRQEGLVAFPEGYLETNAGTTEYSGYVTSALNAFYVSGGGALDAPAGFPGSETDPTELPFLGSLPSQQFRSRAVYIDHVGSEAEALINCIRRESVGYDPEANPDGPTPGDTCGAPGVQNYLEILPFFEVQTTFLSDWTEDPPGNPVAVSSLAITAQNPIPDRGSALLVDASAPGQSVLALAEMNRGNAGLAAVNPVRPSDSKLDSPDAVKNTELFVDVNGGLPDGGEQPEPALYYWTADFTSSVGGVNTSGVTLTAEDCPTPNDCNTYCARTSETLSCARPRGSGGGKVTLSGYYKNAGTDLWVCATGTAGLSVVNLDPSAAVKNAVISWDNSRNISGVTLTIQNSSCQ